MKVRDAATALEALAPTAAAEEWDNVGLLIGDADARLKTLMLCIDLTAEVLAEAREHKAEMVMAYHPVIFKPLSRLTAETATVAWAAARAGLAVFSLHTALDVAAGGTNDALAESIGLSDLRPLRPISGDGLCKVVVFTQPAEAETVARAAFDAGAGWIGNYSRCAFTSAGEGQFHGEAGSKPAVGRAGQTERTQELRIEITAPLAAAGRVAKAIRQAHSYEEPVVDVYPLAGPTGLTPRAGMGRVGRLARRASIETLLRRAKRAAGVRRALVARPPDDPGPIEVAACAAGSAGSLWKDARAAGAQLYLTGEMRHHDALAAAAAGLTVVCLGHSNSERPALARVAEHLAAEMPKLNVLQSQADRDPFEIE